MGRRAAFAILLVLTYVLLAGCSSAEPRRAEEAAFKGMELYSWKPAGEDWHFSLLAGTNSQKPVSTIMAPQTAVVGIADLKQRLARLAEGEQVFWRNVADEPVPGELANDLSTFCTGLGIKLEKLWLDGESGHNGSHVHS
jgi:hypothetical protein